MARNQFMYGRSGRPIAFLAAIALAVSVGLSAFGADKTPQLEQDLAATATQAALKQRSLQATLTAQAQPATSTRTPAPTVRPTRTPTRRAAPVAEVLLRSLSIRTGPGTSFPVVGNTSVGQQFPVIGQTSNCAWLQILLEDGRNVWISGSPSYTSLNVPCNTIPVVGTPAQAVAPKLTVTATVRPKPTTPPAPTSTNTPLPATPTPFAPNSNLESDRPLASVPPAERADMYRRGAGDDDRPGQVLLRHAQDGQG